MSRKSKSHKQAKKNRQGKERKRRRLADVGRSTPKSGKLARADDLMARRQWHDARETLEEFDRAKPGRPEVLRRLLDIYHEIRDYADYCRTCRQLLRKFPDDPALHVMYADGLLKNAQLASSLLAFRKFVERWPDHPLTDGARENIARLERADDDLTADMPFPPDERLELAALHEDVLGALQEGDDDRCIRIGEELHRRCPEFLPVLNNLSAAYFRKGRLQDALAMSQRVLDADPENIHALGNRARYALLCGHLDEAASLAERLRSLKSDEPDLWTKQAEAFSYLGDDKAVLEAMKQAEQASVGERKSPDSGLLLHLAGVAFARQGDWKEAKAYWKKSLEAYPSLSLAQENLADLSKPAAERHAPFPFHVSYWIRRETARELAVAMERSQRGNKKAELEQLVQRHPEVPQLVPLLLDRGDDWGRELALRFAKQLKTPQMIEALREFCLSNRGPDKMRIDAANFLSDEGELPAGAIRMWQQGQWREVLILGFEVIEEPVGEPHSPQVDEWAGLALEALQDGDGEAAEGLLKRCLEIEPGKPDLLNNLATAYQMQDRTEEHEQLVREIHERFPDYFFGRIALAMIVLDEGDFERAEALLAPLFHQKKLHITEFRALCSAQVHLSMKRGNLEAAESWADIWRRIEPDHPMLRSIEERLTFAKRLGSFDKFLDRF